MGKTLSKIKPHWEIRFKDIDPDTGSISQDKPMAISMSEEYANLIVKTLSIMCDEPNRDFYIYERKEIEV